MFLPYTFMGTMWKVLAFRIAVKMALVMVQ